jgi:2-polyprenyl-3-methyl-5-hydroxy-6-metoxy-1,4-benzoquinol methylase
MLVRKRIDMPETVSYCPLCNSDHSRLFDRREFRGQTATNRVCLNCGLVYQSPRMTEAEAAEFYAAEYRRMYQGDEGPNAKDLAVQRARADSLFAFTHRHVEHVTRHLDIGCSSGLLLQRFHDGFGSQPVGIEPGDAYRSHARAQGISVYASLDELKQNESTRFDLISMAHVLEHLPDPVGYLAHLRETLIAPGGALLLEVPNLYAHDSFETAHLLAFSPLTLAATVEQAGYEIIQIEAHGRPRTDIVPYYLTVLAKPRTQGGTVDLRREKMVGLKRRLGLFRRRVLSRLLPKKAWKNL